MFRRVCTCPSPGLTVVLLVAAPAFAAGISPVDSTGAGEAGYLAPTSGQNPHGGYSAATNKCKACHVMTATVTNAKATASEFLHLYILETDGEFCCSPGR